MSGADSTAKLTDALIDRLDRMLEILGRIASAAEARRVVVDATTETYSPHPKKPSVLRNELMLAMHHEKTPLQYADKQKVLILWFASKLWDSVETSVEMYTRLFHACNAYTPKREIRVSEQSFNEFKAGNITSELTSWAKSHCRECFREPLDVSLPTMISEFYKNMGRGPPPTA